MNIPNNGYPSDNDTQPLVKGDYDIMMTLGSQYKVVQITTDLLEVQSELIKQIDYELNLYDSYKLVSHSMLLTNNSNECLLLMVFEHAS